MSVITIESWQRGRSDDDPEYYRALEDGHILFFPRTPFELSEEDRAVMLAQRLVQSGYHKNIAYKPAKDRVSNFTGQRDDAEKLCGAMRRYSQAVVTFTQELLPRYARGMRIDYASLRTEEEAGRQLPIRLRNDLLHVDAFPTRPTRGDRIMRVFTNINPERPRVWLTKETFEPLAKRFAASSGLLDWAVRGQFRRAVQRLASAVGLPVTVRSPYDEFMLALHHFMKENSSYQQEPDDAVTLSFPPESTWIVFTDEVAHAVKSGQYMIEQTFLVPRESLLRPGRAPISILEGLAGARMQ